MNRQKLRDIYRLYDQWVCEFTFACRKGCATCCTQSVSITTLEGELIQEYIHAEKPELFKTLESLPHNSLNQQTTNQFAKACLEGKVAEEEVEDWDLTPCVFLQNDCCSIYPVRSFMCRSFGSKNPCHQTGTAEVDPLFLTLNTIIMQCIEHLDQGRPWGNMNIVLQLLQNKDLEGKRKIQNNYRLAAKSD